MKERIKYKVISAAALFVASLAALFTAACTGYTEPEVKIQVTRSEIFADGHDAVAFKVEFEGEDVTSEAVITNEATGEVVEGGIFSTQTPGRYNFIATYSGIDALQSVTVTAREASLQLTLDYYADGDTSHFTFNAVYGTLDVSADDGFIVYEVIDNETGEALQRDADGYYRITTQGDERRSFRGEWNGYVSLPVTAGPVKFYKRVGILEFTGTWCQWCPRMVEYLEGVELGYSDRYVLAAVHGQDQLTVPYGTVLASKDGFKVPSFPALVIDFNTLISGDVNQLSASILENRMKEIINANPADCGIAISSVVDGTTATVTVNLLSAEAKEYGIAVALTEDGITGYPQKMPDGSVEYDYVHDHTLREVYQDNIEGVSVGTVAAGSQAEREFTFDLKDYNPDNCNIVVFATSKEDGQTVMDNAVECKLGESVDFQYESI